MTDAAPTALIVVDVQNFFLHDAPDELPDKITSFINDNQFQSIAFTVFKNVPGSNFERSLQWIKCSGSQDIELPKQFEPYANHDNIFYRATYSGFAGTALTDYLKSNGITRTVICGVDTDACVLATAFSAFDNGYLVEVNFDLTFSSADMEGHARAIIGRSLAVRGDG